jgi:hypothetical protein
MTFNVIYASAVYDDIQHAIDFYNSRRKGLGLQFYKSLKNRISFIKTNAFAFQIRYADVRCVPLPKFPYTIHYRLYQDTNTIQVLAVFCDYQFPEIWETRLK